MVTLREQYIILVSNDVLRPTDALVVLTGDGLYRAETAVALFRQEWAPCILISGGLDKKEQGSIHADEIARMLEEQHIPKECIITEADSMHTWEQAVNVMRIAKDSGWKRIIIIASHYHQYRAFLTFLQAMDAAEYPIDIVNAPSRRISWFEAAPSGKRFDFLEAEFQKIEAYQAKGHVASYERAISYFRLRETEL